MWTLPTFWVFLYQNSRTPPPPPKEKSSEIQREKSLAKRGKKRKDITKLIFNVFKKKLKWKPSNTLNCENYMKLVGITYIIIHTYIHTYIE